MNRLLALVAFATITAFLLILAVLGTILGGLMRDGRLKMLAPFSASRIDRMSGGLAVEAMLGGEPTRLEVDRIVVATGFRPDL